MQVTILAFAQARDQLGWSERVIVCSPEDTPRSIFARIAPELHFKLMRVAVDQEYQSWDHPIGEVSEIALIPPVSGG